MRLHWWSFMQFRAPISHSAILNTRLRTTVYLTLMSPSGLDSQMRFMLGGPGAKSRSPEAAEMPGAG